MADTTEWLGVLDEIHDSLAHGLNGRLAGISGVAQVARMRGALDDELLALLDDELTRLRALAHAAATVPRQQARGQPLTSVADAVADVQTVAQLHKRPVHAELPDEGLVVRMMKDDLARCMLLALAAVQGATDGAGEGGRIRVSTDAGVMRMLLLPAETAAVGGLNTRALAEAERLLEGVGGNMAAADGEATVELRIPLAW